MLVYYRNGQKSQKHYRNFLFLVWCLLGVLEGACIGWRSITEIIRCRSSFATARKRKQAFFLLALNRKSLASLEIWVLYRSLVWGGLVLCWFITEMDRNDGSITEIFFLLEVCLLGLLEVACWGWRSITETFLASLEIWVLV